MNSQIAENQLIRAMQKLEEAAEHILKTDGYTRDTKKMRLLLELIKEQIHHENSLSATRKIR